MHRRAIYPFGVCFWSSLFRNHKAYGSLVPVIYSYRIVSRKLLVLHAPSGDLPIWRVLSAFIVGLCVALRCFVRRMLLFIWPSLFRNHKAYGSLVPCNTTVLYGYLARLDSPVCPTFPLSGNTC